MPAAEYHCWGKEPARSSADLLSQPALQLADALVPASMARAGGATLSRSDLLHKPYFKLALRRQTRETSPVILFRPEFLAEITVSAVIFQRPSQETFLSVPVIINLAGRLTARQIRLRNNTTLHTLMDFKDVQEETEDSWVCSVLRRLKVGGGGKSHHYLLLLSWREQRRCTPTSWMCAVKG